MIRNLLMVTLLLAFAATPVRAQFLEITPYYGVMFGGNLEVEEGDLVLGTADNFGMSIGLRLSDNALLEVSYTRQDTKLKLKGATFQPDEDLFDIAAEYYQVGGIFETTKMELIRMYGLVSFGVTRFNPTEEDEEVTTDWRVSGALGGGFKYFVNKRLGVRAQMRLLGTLVDSTGGLYCDEEGQTTENRCFTSKGGGQLVIQADFTLGLVLAL